MLKGCILHQHFEGVSAALLLRSVTFPSLSTYLNGIQGFQYSCLGIQFWKWSWKGPVVPWLCLFIQTFTSWLIHQQSLAIFFSSSILLLVLLITKRSAHSCSATPDTLQAKQKKNLFCSSSCAVYRGRQNIDDK